MSFFIVTALHGPSWDDQRSVRDQDGFADHAAFMDELVADGFVFVGGPYKDGRGSMLIVKADDEQQVRARLAPDPWSSAGLLEIGAVDGWSKWLDSSTAPSA